jgi:AraC family ethanolamine operon transcriptional activator
MVKPLCRYSLVKQAETLIQDRPEKPFTVYDLCAQLHISERTLRYAFRDVCGMGPKTYLQNYRLHRVRAGLKNSSPKETTIMAIAQQWGFWHMGQFGQDYKKLFGELLSETLRRP